MKSRNLKKYKIYRQVRDGKGHLSWFDTKTTVEAISNDEAAYYYAKGLAIDKRIVKAV